MSDQMRIALAWAYQFVGANGGSAAELDNLSAALEGKPIPHAWKAAEQHECAARRIIAHERQRAVEISDMLVNSLMDREKVARAIRNPQTPYPSNRSPITCTPCTPAPSPEQTVNLQACCKCGMMTRSDSDHCTHCGVNIMDEPEHNDPVRVLQGIDFDRCESDDGYFHQEGPENSKGETIRVECTPSTPCRFHQLAAAIGRPPKRWAREGQK